MAAVKRYLLLAVLVGCGSAAAKPDSGPTQYFCTDTRQTFVTGPPTSCAGALAPMPYIEPTTEAGQ